MLVLVTYDVNTMTSSGQKRLRKVAKTCQKYGQRVQNSVFECIINSTQYTSLRLELLSIIHLEEDSLRLYKLGDNYKTKVEHHGTKASLDLEAPLVF